MDVHVSIGDDLEVLITEVHPVALHDVIGHALDAALRLNRELHPTDAD